MGLYGSGYTGTSSPVSGAAVLAERGYIYSDLDLAFMPSPFFTSEGLSGDIVRKYDSDSIKQSVKNIVLTNRYERPYRPLMGSNIRDILFENFDGWLRVDIVTAIEDQLDQYEPRVEVYNIIIEDDIDNAGIRVQIDYIIKSLGGNRVRDNVVVKISMERVR